MNTIPVRLPNGRYIDATFRNEETNSAYVRVMAGPSGSRKLTTISGRVSHIDNTFIPTGKNAHLATTVQF